MGTWGGEPLQRAATGGNAFRRAATAAMGGGGVPSSAAARTDGAQRSSVVVRCRTLAAAAGGGTMGRGGEGLAQRRAAVKQQVPATGLAAGSTARGRARGGGGCSNCVCVCVCVRGWRQRIKATSKQAAARAVKPRCASLGKAPARPRRAGPCSHQVCCQPKGWGRVGAIWGVRRRRARRAASRRGPAGFSEGGSRQMHWGGGGKKQTQRESPAERWHKGRRVGGNGEGPRKSKSPQGPDGRPCAPPRQPSLGVCARAAPRAARVGAEGTGGTCAGSGGAPHQRVCE
ncbi:MAG: hypothetical protein J3K34DRAFT_117145 [Monoraphidium minutum]|nr:MAG: hypothetical protein J3K34DRAFT_117145 [Monoraphidium minutum]